MFFFFLQNKLISVRLLVCTYQTLEAKLANNMEKLKTYVLNQFFLATFLMGSSSVSIKALCGIDPPTLGVGNGSLNGDRMASNNAESSSYATRWRPLVLQA